MKARILNSITNIQQEHCYQTRGSKPVRVLCDDLNYYVCKYAIGRGFPTLLFNEYIAACFLKIWKLPVPDFGFVQIKTEHVKQTGLPFHFFEKPCFGSLYLGELMEVDKFFLSEPLLKNVGEEGIFHFLKIALFDIWMCNEDRHFENLNLLYNLKKNDFVPIDHAFCFNTNNLDKVPYLISDNESLLDAPFLNRFFNRHLQTKTNEIRLEILNEFRNDTNACCQQLEPILAGMPSEWEPNRKYLKERLDFFLSDYWLTQCQNFFTRLFVQNLNSN